MENWIILSIKKLEKCRNEIQQTPIDIVVGNFRKLKLNAFSIAIISHWRTISS